MPLGKLRYCSKCLTTRQTLTHEVCECGGKLLPFLDENGAISRGFLVARGFCCSNGCRNCPYKQAATFESAGAVQTIKCPRCRGTFACGGEGCWCDKVRLSPPTLKWLQRNFAGCLCPSCLAEFSAA